MFQVQIVRWRGGSDRRGGLQALRRCMDLSVGDRHLKIFVGSSQSVSQRRSLVMNIAQTRIKSARVRGRLLRVDLDDGQSLLVRLRDEEEALQAAESMMETWEIDPLVEGSGGLEASTEEDDVDSMTELTERYMTSPRFRELVHKMHDNFDAILADAQQSYKARV